MLNLSAGMSKESSQILLGYPADPEEPHHLHRRFFPSKIGGKPAWLNPHDLPNGDVDLHCKKCRHPMTFLLQIYASRNQPLDAFHRILYVFCCCNCGDEFVALRSQLPRVNQYYPPYPADKINDTDISDTVLSDRCCYECGIPTNKRESVQVMEILGNDTVLKKTDTANHNEHIDINKKNGEESVLDKTESLKQEVVKDSLLEQQFPSKPQTHYRCQMAVKWGLMSTVFPEAELEIDEALSNSDTLYVGIHSNCFVHFCFVQEDFTHEELLIKKYKLEETTNPDGLLDESEQEAFADIHKERLKKDVCFDIFLKYMKCNPGHVIRYDADGASSPLWVTSHNKPTIEEIREKIKCCSNCGGPRQFEFQVQPNLIYELKTDRLTFGVICIYTCEASCSPSLHLNSAYIEEGIICQKEPFRDG